MTLTLVVANKVYSSWSMRPWLLMRHFQIPFDEVVIPMDEPTSKQAMLRHAPTGKCPALHEDDVAVWDSLAIVEYLAERFPEKPIWPRDVAARATARSLAAEMHSGFIPLRRHCPMNMRRDPTPRVLDLETQVEIDRDVARIEDAWRDTHARFGANGPFLFGAFCAADAMFAPVVDRFRAYAVPVGDETACYMATMMALPAWTDWRVEALAEGWRLDRIDAI